MSRYDLVRALEAELAAGRQYVPADHPWAKIGNVLALAQGAGIPGADQRIQDGRAEVKR